MTAVFALGSNGSGQLGILHREDVSVPKPVAFDPAPPSSPITSLAAGGNHTLLLTEAGDVYWSGDAATGACGLTGRLADGAAGTEQQQQQQPAFRKMETGVEADGAAMMVAATWEASILVCRDRHGRARRVYTLGTGQRGELGQGELLVRTPSATLVRDFPPPDSAVVDISASMSHVVAVLSNGDAYGWGVGRKGQLGDAGPAVLVPRRIADVPFPVVRAVCGREFTALFASPQDGRFLVLGSDKWGIRASAPSDATGWADVRASWGGIYVLKQDGRLDAWGRDDHGGLPPPGLPSISRLASGSEHVVALTDDGDVLAWGWGEHGNCGPTGVADAKKRWTLIASKKHIPSGAGISGVAAGCATSWIYITGLYSKA